MSDWDAETAEWYAEKYGEYATNRLGVEAVRFTSNSTVVDIGCGTGSALRHAAKAISSGRLIGIDPAPRMLEIAREQTARHPAAGRIEFYEGAAECLPLEDVSADFVLAFDSFDHWSDRLQGLREVSRVLKPGGQFVVVKDGSLPDGSNAIKRFLKALNKTGFTVKEELSIQEGEVACTHWVCVYGPASTHATFRGRIYVYSRAHSPKTACL